MGKFLRSSAAAVAATAPPQCMAFNLELLGKAVHTWPLQLPVLAARSVVIVAVEACCKGQEVTGLVQWRSLSGS